jgi:uncharacterized protein YkwD
MKLNRFLLFAFINLGLFAGLTSFTHNNYSSLVDDVLSQTNKFRKSRGLSALINNDDLNAIAQKLIPSIYRFAENVAYGATTGKEVVNDWKNSPPHRKNMLGRYKYIGIGIAKDRRGRIYYTQIFAG